MRSGLFPMEPDAMLRVYQAPTHALHLHLYDGEIIIGEHYFRLEPGDVTLSPAGLPSSYRLPAAGRHWCVHFRPMAEDTDAAAIPLHIPLGPQRGYGEERFRTITRQHATPSPTPQAALLSEAVAAADLQGFLLWLAQWASLTDESGPGGRSRLGMALDDVVTLIEDHLDSPLRVPELARRAGFSQNYFAKAFRQRFGVTLQRHVRSRRVEMAKYLLERTPLAVSEVGTRVGLPDPQHFNKVFRDVTGSSPSNYRSQADKHESATFVQTESHERRGASPEAARGREPYIAS